MAVDTAEYIGSLDTDKPAGSDPKSEGDDNIRQVKTAAKQSFPGVTGAVTATHTELNYVAGVTAAIQTQLDTLTSTKAALSSPTFTGTPAVPTASVGTSTTQAASTAFVQAAIAGVNAVSGVSYSTSASASFTVSDGQIVAATNTSAVAVTFPASPATGAVCGVHFDNARNDNTINLGANSCKGWNGQTVSGVLTCDQSIPVILRWGGDYWRAI